MKRTIAAITLAGALSVCTATPEMIAAFVLLMSEKINGDTWS